MDLVGPVLPAKKFYMVRHGETVANVEGYAAGSLDTPLTDRGRSQAEGLRQIFNVLALAPEVIVHSQLSRARETAKILNASLKLSLVENPDVAECCFGDWAGQPWKAVQERIHGGLEPPNGESGVAFIRRAMRGLFDVVSRYKNALIVTHGGVFDALARNYGCAIADVENCHLYEFDPQEFPRKFPWDVWRHYLIDSQKTGRSGVDVAVRTQNREVTSAE